MAFDFFNNRNISKNITKIGEINLILKPTKYISNFGIDDDNINNKTNNQHKFLGNFDENLDRAYEQIQESETKTEETYVKYDLTNSKANLLNKLKLLDKNPDIKIVAIVHYSSYFYNNPPFENYIAVCDPVIDRDTWKIQSKTDQIFRNNDKFLLFVLRRSLFEQISKHFSFQRRIFLVHSRDYSAKDMRKLDTIIKNRTDIKIRYILESPQNDPLIRNKDHFKEFHQEMSFRRYSKNSFTYLQFFDINEQFKPEKIPFRKKRNSSLVVFINSNCGTSSKREKFVQKLINSGLKIDCLGICLRNFDQNSDEVKIIRSYDRKKFIELISHYKFFISIENSICDDYISEKLGNAAKAGVIPIIYRDNKNMVPCYDRFVPINNENNSQKSYINLADYKSAKEARDHIEKIGNNETLYNNYLQYKNPNLSKKEISKIKQRMMKNPDQPYFPTFIHKKQLAASLTTCKIGDKALRYQPEYLEHLKTIRNINCYQVNEWD